MLVELSVVEQRYQAVLAVIRDGVPIVEVARRFGVSRQAVHRWLRWYEDQVLPNRPRGEVTAQRIFQPFQVEDPRHASDV